MPDLFLHLRELAGPDEPHDRDRYDSGLQALMEELDRSERRPSRHRSLSRRPHRRRAAFILGPIAALLVAGGGYAALHSDAPASAGVECHETASTTGNESLEALDGRSPTAICTQAWREGGLSNSAAGRQPPPLQACIAPGKNRAVQVFPAEAGVCHKLGFKPASPTEGTTNLDRRFVSFKREVYDEVTSVRCRSESEARQIVGRALHRHDLVGWKIAIGPGIHGEGFSSERPCASPMFDSPSSTVTLVPTPPGG